MRAVVVGENGGPVLPVLQPGCSVGVDILLGVGVRRGRDLLSRRQVYRLHARYVAFDLEINSLPQWEYSFSF